MPDDPKFSRPIAPDEFRVNPEGVIQHVRIRLEVAGRPTLDRRVDACLAVLPDREIGGTHCVVAGTPEQIAQMLAELYAQLHRGGLGSFAQAVWELASAELAKEKEQGFDG